MTATTQDSGVIMGVRHRTYTVEAVQYHPESCMSEGGRGLMANFLKYTGGKWGGENEWCGVRPSGEAATSNSVPNGVNGSSADTPKANGVPSLPTILEKIHTQRLQDVEAASSSPSATQEILSTSLRLHTAPPLISFVDRVKSTPHTAVMAEIKRASPSKGDIAPGASAPAQALRYALAGASVISVLTEPTWFKGNLTDMLAVRQALDSLPNRPAVLRKDFILSTYQIDEARLYGADTVLLIVAMLKPEQLKELYAYSVSVGMEPLVEVNNTDELVLALELGAKIVGVNNRNLHDFNVDMSTTSRVNEALAEKKGKTILCALSGISSPADVERYVKEGVRAVLVGESLMRAADPTAFLRELIGLPPSAVRPKSRPMVKICGCRSAADAQIAIDAGADLLGIILVPGTKRHVGVETAREIAAVVRTARARSDPSSTTGSASSSSKAAELLPWFAHHAKQLARRRKPLLVGVVQNQPLDEVLDLVDSIGLDMVQLHGDEPQSWAKLVPVPVVKVFRVSADGAVVGGQIDRPGLNQYVLLDAAPSSGVGAGGGEGKSFPWEHAHRLVAQGEVGSEERFPLPVILAGGLTPDNVGQAIEQAGEGVLMVDVSSGTDAAGGQGKDKDKVEAFVRAVKG